MLKPKKRISKQDLKEDKFVKTTLQVKSYIDENYRQVVSVVLGIFAIIVIFIVYGQLKEQTSQEAKAELGIAQVEYSNNNLDKASERLISLIEEYGSTDEGQQAGAMVERACDDRCEIVVPGQLAQPALQVADSRERTGIIGSRFGVTLEIVGHRLANIRVVHDASSSSSSCSRPRSSSRSAWRAR